MNACTVWCQTSLSRYTLKHQATQLSGDDPNITSVTILLPMMSLSTGKKKWPTMASKPRVLLQINFFLTNGFSNQMLCNDKSSNTHTHSPNNQPLALFTTSLSYSHINSLLFASSIILISPFENLCIKELMKISFMWVYLFCRLKTHIMPHW